MLCEADIRVSWRSRPRGFAALMSLYESNYLRFVHLAGNPARLSGRLVSYVDGDCELHLAVIEHMRYTTMLALTYVLPSTDQRTLEAVPDLTLLVYHDARLLEADAPGRRHYNKQHEHNVRGRDAGPGERELHQRWKRNMMLNKWLEYCAERGHRFMS